jgi:hypothetical protein
MNLLAEVLFFLSSLQFMLKWDAFRKTDMENFSGFVRSAVTCCVSTTTQPSLLAECLKTVVRMIFRSCWTQGCQTGHAVEASDLYEQPFLL